MSLNKTTEFEHFFKENYSQFYFFFLHLVDDEEVSRDVVSDAFEYAWKNFQKSDVLNWRIYIYFFIRNKSVDYIRHEIVKTKYAEIFHAPLGLDAFFDYDEGLAYAKKVNKPVFIDFTGHACVNCRKMEASVWPDKEVLSKLSNDYVVIQLYVDDKTDLTAAEQTVSKYSGKEIETIGNKWSDLQASRFNANSQPFYVLLDTKGDLLVQPKGADYDPKSFAGYLNSGLDAFKRNLR